MSIQNAESRGVKLQNSTLLGKEQQMQSKTYYLYWTTAPVARSSDQPINKRQSSNQQTHKQTRKKTTPDHLLQDNSICNRALQSSWPLSVAEPSVPSLFWLS